MFVGALNMCLYSEYKVHSMAYWNYCNLSRACPFFVGGLESIPYNEVTSKLFISFSFVHYLSTFIS